MNTINRTLILSFCAAFIGAFTLSGYSASLPQNGAALLPTDKNIISNLDENGNCGPDNPQEPHE